MNEYEEKLKYFMHEHKIQGEHLSFSGSCHSVADAALAVNTTPDNFVKSICLMSSVGLIVAVVKGEDRVSTTLVGQVLEIMRPRVATPEEILDLTGYPCGGTPSFGYPAVFLVDSRVLEKETVYMGGGSQNSLVRISTSELARANLAKIVDIRK